jgi:erythromycin esterase
MKSLYLISICIFFTNFVFAQKDLEYIPISSYEPEYPTEDLQQLNPYFENVKLIGLGESTHGTSEFTVMRHRLFRFLVEEHGYNTLFLEEDYATCLRVDAYIKGADDTLNDVAKSLNQWPWITKEMADLIEWMRAHNANEENEELSFVGIDLQYYQTTLDVIDSILISNSPELENELTVSETTDREFMTKSDTMGIQKFEAIVKERQSALDTIELPSPEKSKLKHLTRGLQFIIEEKRNLAHAFYRDMKMAENIMAHFAESPKTKGIFWAHNVHISTSCPYDIPINCRAGVNLRNWMGDEFFSPAFEFDAGSFNAYYLSNKEGDKEDFDNYTLGKVSVDPAPDGSIAARMRNSDDSIMFIPEASFQKRKDRKLAGRHVGASFTNYSKNGSQTYFENWYSHSYDAILLIKTTSATDLLVDQN